MSIQALALIIRYIWLLYRLFLFTVNIFRGTHCIRLLLLFNEILEILAVLGDDESHEVQGGEH